MCESCVCVSPVALVLSGYDASQAHRLCPVWGCLRDFGDKGAKPLAKHVNKEHCGHDPNEPRFKAWLEASNRGACSTCLMTFSKRQKHACTGAVALEMKGDCLGSDSISSAPPETKKACKLPKLMDILSTPIPTVKRVPQQCRVAVAKSFTALMRQCATPSTPEQELRAWSEFLMFPKCVLRTQPSIRGGRKKKLKRNEQLKSAIVDRVKRWEAGEQDKLWAESLKLFVSQGSRDLGDSMAANIGGPPSVPRMGGTGRLCLRCCPWECAQPPRMR